MTYGLGWRMLKASDIVPSKKKKKKSWMRLKKTGNGDEGQHITAGGEKVKVETRVVPMKNDIDNEGRRITKFEHILAMQINGKQRTT